ncbi:oxygen-binding di-iron domain-containing protein [Nautilia lithotrophica]
MDFSKPIEIAPDVYWIGYVIPDDPFQCHVYLIKNGSESILIDPGSMITFPVVLEKLTSLIELKDIKYIIMHHQDPDIVGCYSTFEKIMPKGERYIVTHWRTEMLLKHYMWETPFYLIDQHNWKLKAGKRELEFVFTPYAHFPGAFCTYDKKTGILFSSDLFGGLTDEFSLFAKDVDDYFEAAKPFHKHYMPSKEVLHHALKQVQKKHPLMIAPQHGSIIKKELIDPLIEKLKDLECGLYLLDDYESDLFILNKTDEVLKKFFKDTVSLSSFNLVLRNLFDNIKNVIPSIQKIEICGISPLSEVEHCFSFGEDHKIVEIDHMDENYSYKKVLLQNDKKIGDIYIIINKNINKKDKKLLEMLLNKIAVPIAISLEKELILRELEDNNKKLYEKSISDPLTKLYNREYMKEFLTQKIEEAKRYKFPLSVAMIDIDFFKKINDTYGHLIGDCALKELAELLKSNFRGSDIVSRYGGEEIFIIMPFTDSNNACKKLENFRKLVEEHNFCDKKNIKFTISAGVCEYSVDNDENVEDLILKADRKVYFAKKQGRNKVICEKGG